MSERSEKLIQLPSTHELRLALFDGYILSFGTDEGEIRRMHATSVRRRKNDNDGWNVEGYVVDAHSQRTTSQCRAAIWPPIQKGVFEDFGPEKEEKDAKYFDRMTDEELCKEIATSREFALFSKGRLDKYMKTLSPHDHLVAEAMATHKMAEATLHTDFSHNLYMRTEKQKRVLPVDP